MAITSKAEAVAFLQSYQLMFKDKVGFKHFSGQISELIGFIESASMGTLEAISTRYSCRSFNSQMPPEEALRAIGQAALASPSGVNRQGWQVIMVRDQQLIADMDAAGLEVLAALPDKSSYERIMARPTGKLFYNAPCMAVVAIEPATPPGAEYFDCGIVAQDIALAATALGLNSLICGFAVMPFAGARHDEFCRRLGFPSGYEMGLAVLLGYSAEPTPAAPHAPNPAKLSWVG
jgi:nitroreductase